MFCMLKNKKYILPIREHAMEIINFKKKKMKLLTKEQQESYANAQMCYTRKEKFVNKYVKDKKYHQARNNYHYAGEYKGAVYSICNLKYIVPKSILIAFHNGSNYDYNFIIKELAEEFEIKITQLG